MPPEKAPVSVIVPAYRAASTIRRALMSVAGQTIKPDEVIVVDDGSDDGTHEAALACRDDMAGMELKVIRQPNMGAGAARNRAIKEATRPILAFLDADDEWLPEKLERSLARMEGTDHVLVAHNGWIVEDGQKTLIDGARRFSEGGNAFHSLYRKGYIDTCTVLARRDAVIAAGGFDETLPNAQDFQLWLAMCREPGATFEVFDEVLSIYHVTSGGIMSHTASRLRCCLEVALRHAPDLKHHPGSALASLWFRVIAVHYEAMKAYRSTGRTGKALIILVEAPVQLLILTTAFLSGRGSLENNDMNDGGKLLPILLWGWVGTIISAYLFQYRDLAGPILNTLGLE